MLQEAGEETLKHAVEALREVGEAVLSTSRGMDEVSLEKGLERASKTDEAYKAALEAMSAETGSPEFLLDMWCGETGRSREQVEGAIDRARKRLDGIVQEKRHPDNVPEILDGKYSGLVFLPRQLMVDLYRLGESVLDGRSRPYQDLGALDARVSEQAKDWVAYCRRRWGPPPESELVPVSQLSQEEADTVGPDDGGDPPF